VAKTSRQWTAYDKLEAILPVLGTVLPLRHRTKVEVLQKAEATRVDDQMKAALAEVSAKTGVAEEEVSLWIEHFASFGEPGLLAPVEVDVAKEARNQTGTWELVSRYTDGKPTAARGHNYYDIDPATGKGYHLITIWTEQNHFVDPAMAERTFCLVAGVELSFRQKGKYILEATTDGMLVGNFGDYETGEKVHDVFHEATHMEGMRMLAAPSSYAQTLGRKSGDTPRPSRSTMR